MENIDDLHFTWEESVDNFFQWLENICGVDTSSEMYEGLQNRIMNMEELDMWIDCWNGDPDKIHEVSEEYFSTKRANKDTYTY